MAPGACLACVGSGSGLDNFSDYNVAKSVSINLAGNLIFNAGIDKVKWAIEEESHVPFLPSFHAQSKPD